MADTLSMVSIICFVIAGILLLIAIVLFYVLNTKEAYKELRKRPPKCLAAHDKKEEGFVEAPTKKIEEETTVLLKMLPLAAALILTFGMMPAKETWSAENGQQLDCVSGNLVNTVSGPNIATDTEPPIGQIYVKIDGDEAEDITGLSAEYKKIIKDQQFTILFAGKDLESKIAKVDFCSSDRAWTVNDASAWEKLDEYQTIMFEKEEAAEEVKADIDFVTKEQERNKFYYVRVTDYDENVSYISSGGVLKDNTVPAVTIALQEADNQKQYHGKNVYADHVEFSLEVEDLGITSGISKVEVTLLNNSGEMISTYTAASDIWEAEDDMTEIEILNASMCPNEEQIKMANQWENPQGLTAKLEDLTDGYYTLSAKVTDKAGNVSKENRVSFIKDSAEPKIAVENCLTYQKERTNENFYTEGYLSVTVEDMTFTTDTDGMITGIDDDAENWRTTIDESTGLITKAIRLTFGENCTYQEGVYRFVVNVKDVLGRESEYQSGDFIVDYTAPTFEVSFSETSETAYTEDENKYYYNRDLVAEFKINKKNYFDDDTVKIVVFKTAADSSEELLDVIKWENNTAYTSNENYRLEHDVDKNTFQLTIKGIPENDHDGYRFSITGRDKAGNSCVPSEPEDLKLLEAVYVMDVTAPVLESVIYDTENLFHTVGTKDYVRMPTKLTFRMKEHNPMVSQFAITSEGNGCCQWEITKVTDVYTTELNVPMLGKKGDEQTITLKIADKAGNAAVLGTGTELRSINHTKFEEGVFTDKFTVDTVAPIIKLEYETYNPNRCSIGGIDYFKQPITVKATVDEHNFDESLFRQPIKKTDDAVIYTESDWTSAGDIHVKTFTFIKDNQYDLAITGTDNAKNALDLQPVDKVTAANAADSTIVLKVAVDQTLPAAGDAAKPIVVINPSVPANITTDGQALYNADAAYEVAVYDPLLNKYASGIDNIIFTVKGEDGTTASCAVDKAGSIVNGTGLTVTRVSGDPEKLAKGADNKYIFHVKIASTIFNTNGIVLSVNAEDVSTNEKDAAAKAIAIDTTAPKAVISYDNNDVSNDKYFHSERTATVTVTERNFCDDCFRFLVNGKRKNLEFKLTKAGSGNRDDAVWTASYTFGSDGDYEVDCIVNDCAVNNGSASYSGAASQDFTVDMTNPVVKIEFDNHHAFNESYYDAQRVATIIITEHNFDGSDVVISGESINAGIQVTYPTISAWSSNGDVHRATLTFSKDALYTLDVEYEDLASNKANDITEERFTVDTTDPELTITGVKNEMPYSGEVRPRINFSDNNYDRYEVSLTRTERENVIVDITEEIIGIIGVAIDGTGRGVGGKLIEDMEHLEENDGIYTLTVTIYDKAGRSKEETVAYSVNRFGSVYVYSKDLAAMLKGYHKASKGNLYITVYNANQLMENSTKLEITCDGAAVANQRSLSDVKAALQPNHGGWFEYKFELDHADFANDGRYKITISDKDEAGNTRTNSENPIEFYIDATAPVLDSVIGMEEAIVNTDTQTVQYTVSDAIALKSVKIYINGKQVEHIEKFDSLNAHNSAFTIGAGMKQKVRIVAEDKTGNVLDTAAESFAPAFAFQPEITVSTDFFVRWYANTPLFLGSAAGIIAAAVGVVAVLFVKKSS